MPKPYPSTSLGTCKIWSVPAPWIFHLHLWADLGTEYQVAYPMNTSRGRLPIDAEDATHNVRHIAPSAKSVHLLPALAAVKMVHPALESFGTV